GGFDIPNGIGTSQIWEFTPNPAGWVLKNATLPVPLGYIPTTTIGSRIYTGGGADIAGAGPTATPHSLLQLTSADTTSPLAPRHPRTGAPRPPAPPPPPPPPPRPTPTPRPRPPPHPRPTP